MSTTKQTDRYIEFFETLCDKTGKEIFIKGIKYKITYSNNDVYIIGKSELGKAGIEKSLENIKYKTGEIVN